MPASHARIATPRAARYLTQLTAHTSRMISLANGHEHGGSASPVPRHVESSGREGVMDFGWGRCTLQATDEELVLSVEADDRQGMERIQHTLALRVEGIGRRDGLVVVWGAAGTAGADAVGGRGGAGGGSGGGVVASGRDGAAVAADRADGTAGADPAGGVAIIEALLTPAGRADPYPLYAAALRQGPVLAAGQGAFLVSGYAAVNQALRTPGFGLPDPGRDGETAGGTALHMMSRSILRTNPPDHGRMRSLIAQAFTPRRVASLRPAVEAAVDDLLAGLAESGADGRTVDFMERFAFRLPVTVICELLGVPAADRHRFRRLASDLTEALEPAGDAVRPEGPADAAARELAGYFTHVIAERRAAPGDDLVSALVAARDADDGRLSDEELLANLILLLVAGFETTTDLLGNGLAILLDAPALAGALRSGELEAASFVEEVLRYDSPVQVTTRVARRAGLTLAGTAIPEGSAILLLLAAANRDPSRYPAPTHFDPTRTNTKPLSFGAGPHICLGNTLSRLEATVAFPRLTTRFPLLSTPPSEPRTRRERLVLRGYRTLSIRVSQRAGACG